MKNQDKIKRILELSLNSEFVTIPRIRESYNNWSKDEIIDLLRQIEALDPCPAGVNTMPDAESLVKNHLTAGFIKNGFKKINEAENKSRFEYRNAKFATPISLAALAISVLAIGLQQISSTADQSRLEIIEEQLKQLPESQSQLKSELAKIVGPNSQAQDHPDDSVLTTPN